MISSEAFMDIYHLHRRGYSIRKIAETLGVHRNTVKRHLESNSFPKYKTNKRRESILAPYYQTIHDFLDEDDYQATWIYDRLKKMGYSGGYDTVKQYVSKLKEQKTRLAYLRFETEPGLQAQCDWGDFQVIDAEGKTTTFYAFVIVLGFSRAMYVEFVRHCTMNIFMDCHIHAFKYLQGTPAEVLYDNMKNVVIGRQEGKVVFNHEFLHFSHHYGFQPMAAPPYSPWIKGKVERPINFIRERFWRGYTFTTIEKANGDVLAWLNETANRRIHGTHHQCVQARWEEEISKLGQLPPSDYDTSIKAFRRVYRDCQISYNGNRYQVPHRMVGKKVLLKIKNGLIRIYDDQDLLITYEEPGTKHNLIADPRLGEELRHDKEQLKRKYGKGKGKATRGLINGSLFINVAYRPLKEYERYASGGALWNN
jgi:transposase